MGSGRGRVGRLLLNIVSKPCPPCYKSKMGKRKHDKHGTPEYNAWRSAKGRCNNPRDRMFKTYGERGIKMCREWSEDFNKFFDHVGPKPSPEYSIDRIDNDRGYEPGNVKWSNDFEQAGNKTNNRKFTICCQTKHLKDWSKDFGVSYKRAHERLQSGWDILKALNPADFSKNKSGKNR